MVTSRLIGFALFALIASALGSACSGKVGTTTPPGGASAGHSCLDTVAATATSSCDFNSYAFDPDAERCRYFPKSNCAVTANRFDTLEACIGACDPGGLDRCQLPGDCVVRTADCCGGCEPVKPKELQALNADYADEDNRCAGGNCLACAAYDGSAERPYFGARCVDHRCELFDVRNTELSRCDSDGDCVLREGLECCECASAGPWVAVNTQIVLAANFFGCAPGVCPACGHASRENLRASCVAGKCAIALTKP